MTKLVFLDCETTGLDPDIHDVWEIAIIDHTGREYAWQIRPDLTHADPAALEIGGYYTRHFTAIGSRPAPVNACMATTHPEAEQVGEVTTAKPVAQQVAELLAGALVVGSNPSFDQAFLSRWLRHHGQVWAAHYRTIDVITLGWGRLAVTCPEELRVPPSSSGVALAHGINPEGYARHTALGDARMAADLYQAITGPARNPRAVICPHGVEIDMCDTPECAKNLAKLVGEAP